MDGNYLDRVVCGVWYNIKYSIILKLEAHVIQSPNINEKYYLIYGTSQLSDYFSNKNHCQFPPHTQFQRNFILHLITIQIKFYNFVVLLLRCSIRIIAMCFIIDYQLVMVYLYLNFVVIKRREINQI